MRCAVCGKEFDEDERCNNCYRAKCISCYFFVCSPKCKSKFDQKVEEIFRQRLGSLIGKAVGDEYEIVIAKTSIVEELSRPVRLENLKKTIKKLGLEHWIPYAEHLMFLNEKQPNSNVIYVMLDGELYTVYYSGDIEPTKGYGYHWVRVDGGWQEVRPGDSPCLREFIPDEKMRFPRYGDVEGAPALSVVEHGEGVD